MQKFITSGKLPNILIPKNSEEGRKIKALIGNQLDEILQKC